MLIPQSNLWRTLTIHTLKQMFKIFNMSGKFVSEQDGRYHHCFNVLKFDY